MEKFVGLHAHDCSSVADGLGFPEDHFNFVLENGGDGLAITNHGNMNSLMYVNLAVSKLKKRGIAFKAIYGVEIYYHPDLEEWAKLKQQLKDEPKEEEDLVVEVESESKNKKWADPLRRRHHMILLAQNFEGYKNLCRLITDSYRKGFYRFPRVDLRMLEKWNKGLIMSSACLAGVPSWAILQNHEKGDEAVFSSLDKEFKPLFELFGPERANLEIQFNKLPEQRLCNDYIIQYANKIGCNIVAAADSHYYNPKVWREREMYRLLGQQSKGYNVSVEDLPQTIDELKCELYPKNFDQMFEAYCEMYPDANEQLDATVIQALERTYTIAHEQIEDYQFDTSMKLPKSFLKDKNPDEELKRLCEIGLSNLCNIDIDVYRARLEKELNVIVKKGFSLYFLTLKEALDKIKEEQLIGAGRGSGAGSLVCYLLGITLLDPIKHDLLFERFMSENRAEPPDIDNDIEDRDQALEILKNHFGAENVIAISNFNSMQLKSLIKDISKFYGIPFDEVNSVTSKMELEAKQPILDSVGNDQKLYVFDFDGAYKFSPTFKSFIDKYPQVADSVKILFKQNKSIGRHAGGVIITENANEHMPIIRIRGVDQSPWGEGLTAKHLEPMGLIKYDFLGIATLRIIRRCIERIISNNNLSLTPQEFFEKNLSPNVIGQGELEVFENVYHKGRFCGTFQFAERNAQKFCQDAKPKSVNDVAVITSIFRPGPLSGKADKKYVHLVNNADDVDFYHPVIKEILGDTYGLLVYQEQFMLLAHKLAGFTLTESDELRKLLVKPVTSLGEEMKKKRIEVGQKFIQGCVNSGITENRATRLWEDEILGFISYGFNKSHAVAYAYLSYQSAWLFHHFTDEWICSLLENDPNKEAAMAEVEAVGYKIGTLSILTSGKEYSMDGNVIVPPFGSVKGFGEAAIEELIEKRKDFTLTGSFLDDFNNFFYDVETKTLKNGTIKQKKVWKFGKFNKRALEGLIKLEAMGDLGINQLFQNHAHLHRVLIENWSKKENQDFNIELLAQITDPTDWSDAEKAGFQQDLMGTYDKSLLVSQDIIDYMGEEGILPLSALSGISQKLWWILNGFTKKTSSNGREYWKLYMMDISGQEKVMNYFNMEPKEGWQERGLYVAEMYEANGWVNVKRGTFIKALQ